jgi:hypothetical protein
MVVVLAVMLVEVVGVTDSTRHKMTVHSNPN